MTAITNNPTLMNSSSSYHYYIRDYQGNNRVVVAHNDTVEQQNDYYAYGGPWGDSSTNQGFQTFKYNGKELDRVHGLDWYDYGARRYDPAFAQFTQMDPLCEKYPHLSPYAYCAGNPVNAIDIDGCDTLNISYDKNIWTFSLPIIAKGDDIFNVTIDGKTSTYVFSEKEYGERVNMLNLEIGKDKQSYTLGVYHVSGAEEGGTGFYITPGGQSSTIVNSGLRIPEGVYPITTPTGGEKWRKPGVGGIVSGRGIRFHYAGSSNPRGWTQGCFVLSNSYSTNGNQILFDPDESKKASHTFDELLGGSRHFPYYKDGRRREGTIFPNQISKFLILKSLF